MKKTILFASCAYLLFMVACKKSAPIAPTDPTAPQGNSNVETVIIRNVFIAPKTTWKFVLPAITQGVLDSGHVIASVANEGYVNSADYWHPLPYQFDEGGGYLMMTITGVEVGEVKVSNEGNASVPCDFRFNIVGGAKPID